MLHDVIFVSYHTNSTNNILCAICQELRPPSYSDTLQIVNQLINIRIKYMKLKHLLLEKLKEVQYNVYLLETLKNRNGKVKGKNGSLLLGLN